MLLKSSGILASSLAQVVLHSLTFFHFFPHLFTPFFYSSVVSPQGSYGHIQAYPLNDPRRKRFSFPGDTTQVLEMRLSAHF